MQLLLDLCPPLCVASAESVGNRKQRLGALSIYCWPLPMSGRRLDYRGHTLSCRCLGLPSDAFPDPRHIQMALLVPCVTVPDVAAQLFGPCQALRNSGLGCTAVRVVCTQL